MENMNEIYPIFDRMLTREDREQQLSQRAAMIWLTGLSGSGKSTLSVALERELYRRGFKVRLLDGDNIRSGINKNLGFSPEDRLENIRRIAEIGRLFVDSGIITISAFISPTEEVRELAREIIGADDFMEVYVSTPIEECERRDVKGLYKKARAGVIKEFTGVSQPFEAPTHPALAVDTTNLTVEECTEMILSKVLSRITL
ncbi:MAG: adenylyl-sulfate kinase [Rikenellaceae bacterium]